MQHEYNARYMENVSHEESVLWHFTTFPVRVIPALWNSGKRSLRLDCNRVASTFHRLNIVIIYIRGLIE